MSFMPKTLQSEPKMSIVTGNPQRPAPPIQPTCTLFRPKASFSGSMIAVMAMNRAAETAMATRPAQKSRCGWIAAGIIGIWGFGDLGTGAVGVSGASVAGLRKRLLGGQGGT